MFLNFRFRLLVLVARILCPPSIDPSHHDTPTGSIQARKCPDKIEIDEDILWNTDAWSKMLDEYDAIANARGFLEEAYRK
jgi:hypothetical protein